MGSPQFLDFMQSLFGEIFHFPASVCGQIPIGLASLVLVAEQSGKYLIDNDFFVVSIMSPFFVVDKKKKHELYASARMYEKDPPVSYNSCLCQTDCLIMQFRVR